MAAKYLTPREVEALVISDPEFADHARSNLFRHVCKTDECWNWTAKACANGGYGVVSIGRGRHVRANRLSWLLHKGRIATGLYVCHKCDNTKCVNPEHLFLGTPKDNMLDKEAKGRGTKPPILRGEKHHHSKTSDVQVGVIRNDKRPARLISAQYGISTKTVYRIRRGETRT